MKTLVFFALGGPSTIVNTGGLGAELVDAIVVETVSPEGADVVGINALTVVAANFIRGPVVDLSLFDKKL